MQGPPRFLHNIELQREAERLLQSLGVKDLSALRTLIGRGLPQLGAVLGRNQIYWDNPLAHFDVARIGTR